MIKARSVSGWVEPGVGSALLKFGFRKTLLLVIGEKFRRSIAWRTPEARSLVFTRETIALSGATVFTGVAVGAAVELGVWTSEGVMTVCVCVSVTLRLGDGIGVEVTGKWLEQASSNAARADEIPMAETIRRNSRRFRKDRFCFMAEL